MRKQCKVCGLETDPLYSEYPGKQKITISVPFSHVKGAIECLKEATDWCIKIRDIYGLNENTLGNNAGTWTIYRELEEILNDQLNGEVLPCEQ